jgi:hypothetical protein
LATALPMGLGFFRTKSYSPRPRAIQNLILLCSELSPGAELYSSILDGGIDKNSQHLSFGGRAKFPSVCSLVSVSITRAGQAFRDESGLIAEIAGPPRQGCSAFGRGTFPDDRASGCRSVRRVRYSCVARFCRSRPHNRLAKEEKLKTC